MQKSYTRDARCKDYNNDGTPRIPGGCAQPKGRCRFVHPSDGARWDNARPSVLLSSLSLSAVNSPALESSISSPVFRHSSVNSSKAPGNLESDSTSVPRGLLESSAERLTQEKAESVSLNAGSVYSPTFSPAPSFHGLDEHSDMEVADDNSAHLTPKTTLRVPDKTSPRSTQVKHTQGVINLMDIEGASRSFTKQMVDGLYLHEDLSAAQMRMDDLRRMQHSQLYEHPSATLRDKISAARRDAEQKQVMLSKKLLSRNRKLSQLPELGRIVLDLDSYWQKDFMALESYLDGVEKWLEAVEPQIRPVVAELQRQLPETRAAHEHSKLEGEPVYIPPSLKRSVRRIREVHREVQDLVQGRSQLPEDHLESELLALFEEKQGELYQARRTGPQQAVDRAALRRLDGLKRGNKRLDAARAECDTLIAASVEASIEATLAPRRQSVALLRQQIEENRRQAAESREAARCAISGVHLASENGEADDLAARSRTLQPHMEQRVYEDVDHAIVAMHGHSTQQAYVGLVRKVRDLMEPNLVVAKYLDHRRIP